MDDRHTLEKHLQMEWKDDRTYLFRTQETKLVFETMGKVARTKAVLDVKGNHPLYSQQPVSLPAYISCFVSLFIYKLSKRYGEWDSTSFIVHEAALKPTYMAQRKRNLHLTDFSASAGFPNRNHQPAWQITNNTGEDPTVTISYPHTGHSFINLIDVSQWHSGCWRKYKALNDPPFFAASCRLAVVFRNSTHHIQVPGFEVDALCWGKLKKRSK